MQRIRKKSLLSVLLLYVLTLSQWGVVYAPRDSIRNAALVRKPQLETISGNAKSALTSNRAVRLNLQTVCFLVLLTHFPLNQYLLLSKISWKSINEMLTVFVQNSLNFVTAFLNPTSTFWLFRNRNYKKLIKLHTLKVTPERLKQHPWRWSSTLHPYGHRVREATLFRKVWHGNPIHSYQDY